MNAHPTPVDSPRTTAESPAEDAFTSEGGHLAGNIEADAAAAALLADEARRMAELGVRRSGRWFRYRMYRYESLEEALAFADQDRAQA